MPGTPAGACFSLFLCAVVSHPDTRTGPACVLGCPQYIVAVQHVVGLVHHGQEMFVMVHLQHVCVWCIHSLLIVGLRVGVM